MLTQIQSAIYHVLLKTIPHCRYSPLAPVLANIFMGFYESKWLNESNFNKPKFHLKYVDDILAAFEKEQDSLNF